MLIINHNIEITNSEIECTAVRAQGPGGQHVNKVSTAIQLSFNIHASSLDEEIKEKLLDFKDKRITKKGVIRIVAQNYKSQSLNKKEALLRFQELLENALKIQKPRKNTKPSQTSQEKRLEDKKLRSQTKALRKKVDF